MGNIQSIYTLVFHKSGSICEEKRHLAAGQALEQVNRLEMQHKTDQTEESRQKWYIEIHKVKLIEPRWAAKNIMCAKQKIEISQTKVLQ